MQGPLSFFTNFPLRLKRWQNKSILGEKMEKRTKKQPTVFMYHGIISDNSEISVHREAGAELYDVAVDRFRTQMEWLKPSHHQTKNAFI